MATATRNPARHVSYCGVKVPPWWEEREADTLMRMKVLLVTPPMASWWLKHCNRKNRTLRRSQVVSFVRMIEEGRWLLHHQSVAFDPDGVLRDGQHRLAAIVESETTVPIAVTWDVDPDSFIVVDDHARRTAADAITLDGYHVSSKEIATARAVIQLSGTPHQYLGKQELRDILPVFAPALEFVHALEVGHKKGVGSAPIRAAVALAWFYVEDLSRLSDFADIVAGKRLPNGPPDIAAHLLRELLLRESVKTRDDRFVMFRKTLRAILAFENREPIQKLYASETCYLWPLHQEILARGNP